jgi:hypothetical protein
MRLRHLICGLAEFPRNDVCIPAIVQIMEKVGSIEAQFLVPAERLALLLLHIENSPVLGVAICAQFLTGGIAPRLKRHLLLGNYALL